MWLKAMAKSSLMLVPMQTGDTKSKETGIIPIVIA